VDGFFRWKRSSQNEKVDGFFCCKRKIKSRVSSVENTSQCYLLRTALHWIRK
jgi:hypothetical protein